MQRFNLQAVAEKDGVLIDSATHPVLLRKLWLELQLFATLSGLNQKAGEQFPSAWRSQP